MNITDKKQDSIFELLGVFTKPTKIDCGNCESILEQTARQHLMHLNEYKRIRDGCDAEIAMIEEKRASANTLIDMTEALSKLMKISLSTAPVAAKEVAVKPIRKYRTVARDAREKLIVALFKEENPLEPMNARLSAYQIADKLGRCYNYVSSYKNYCKVKQTAPVIEKDRSSDESPIMYKLSEHAKLNYL